MISITKRLDFSAGHRVLGHSGRCRNLHGHTYFAEITVQSPNLNSLGMVVDFSVVKEKIGTWLDKNWDHGLLLNEEDPQFIHLTQTEEKLPWPMLHGNPTAENMAFELWYWTHHLLPEEMAITNVRIYETPTCWADYKPGGLGN